MLEILEHLPYLRKLIDCFNGIVSIPISLIVLMTLSVPITIVLPQQLIK